MHSWVLNIELREYTSCRYKVKCQVKLQTNTEKNSVAGTSLISDITDGQDFAVAQLVRQASN